MSISRGTVAAIRWGYGFRPGEAGPDGPEALLAELDAPDAGALPFVPPVTEMLGGVRSRRDARQAERTESPEAGAMLAEANARVRALRDPLMANRIRAPVLSPQGFRERLVSFWADHFTTIAKGPQLGLLVPHHIEAVIRPNIDGHFGDLLVAAELHPAMLVFLNQTESVGPDSRAAREGAKGLNENLAREILELHTLGVGGPYGQADVRALAELLTGYSVSLEEGTIFRAGRAQPGAETVLGRSYGGTRPGAGDAVRFLEDVAVHPATAQHLARKLCVHFVRDDPDEDHVAAVRRAWLASGGELRAVYAALLGHPAAWEPVFRKARQPFDFLVAMLRALGAGGEGPLADLGEVTKRAERQLARMGQKLLEPTGPDGWPEEEGAWITPQGIAARVEVVKDYARMYEARLDPRAFVEAALRDAATEPLLFAVSAAEQKWEGLALALLSPEFNRR